MAAAQRYISTSFWIDDFIEELEPVHKLIYLYLLTNPQTNIAGVYKTTFKRIANDTGASLNDVKNAFLIFSERKKAFLFSGYVILPAWPKHQKWQSHAKIKAGIDNIIKELPSEVRESMAREGYAYPIDSLSIPYAYPPNYSNSNSDLNFNKTKSKTNTVRKIQNPESEKPPPDPKPDLVTIAPKKPKPDLKPPLPACSPEKPKRISKKQLAEQHPVFAEFWNIYPGYAALDRKDCLAFFQKLEPDEQQHALAGLKQHVAVDAEARRQGVWIQNFPHAIRWLRRERWKTKLEVPPSPVALATRADLEAQQAAQVTQEDLDWDRKQERKQLQQKSLPVLNLGENNALE